MGRMDDLAQLLTDRTVEGPTAVGLRQGVITATHAGTATVSVRLGGSTVAVSGVRYLASYSPSVGHTVVCLRSGPDLLVIGRVATP
jgi:hypothetical protein